MVMKDGIRDMLHVVSIAASSEAAQRLSRSHIMQSACDARPQKDLKMHGVLSRAQNGIANISYQETSAEQGLPASHSRCLKTGAPTSECTCLSRWEGRNADGGEAVDSGTTRLCT